MEGDMKGNMKGNMKLNPGGYENPIGDLYESI